MFTKNFFTYQSQRLNLLSVLSIIISFCSLTPISGQWHTSYSTFQKKEVNYQIQDDACSKFSISAGVRYNVDGNAGFDQIVITRTNTDGDVQGSPYVFPEVKKGTKFQISDELNLLQVYDPYSGDCDGYILTFSARNNQDYKLHVVRLDQNGKVVCDVSPLENHGKTDLIYDMIQDRDGSVVMVGTSYLSGRPDLLLLRMDLECNAIHAERHIMVIDANITASFGYAINFYNNPIDPNKNSFSIVGRIGQYSMMVLANSALEIKSPMAWDLDADGLREEKAISITQLEDIQYIIGEGEDPNRRKYTYFMAINYQDPDGPILSQIKKYYFPSAPNYPTSVTPNWNSDGFIICGVIDEDPVANEPQHHPYVIEINTKGDVIMSTVQHGNFEYGRLHSVVIDNEKAYKAVGEVWNKDKHETPNYSIIKMDLNLQNGKECFYEVPAKIVSPEIELLKVSHDILGMVPDVVPTFLKLDETPYNQKYCYSVISYTCEDAQLKPIINVSNIGLQYSFFSASTIGSGFILAHTWEIRDGSNTPIVNANSGGLIYTFSVVDNYSVELAVKALLPDGTLCRDTIDYLISAESMSADNNLCPDSLSLKAPWIYPGTYMAGQVINAEGKAVYGVDSVFLYAGLAIELHKGVEVENGDQFVAEIRECKDCCELDNPLAIMTWMNEVLDAGDYDVKRLIFEETCAFQFINNDEEDLVSYYTCDGVFICKSALMNGLSQCAFRSEILEVQGINPCVHVE